MSWPHKNEIKKIVLETQKYLGCSIKNEKLWSRHFLPKLQNTTRPFSTICTKDPVSVSKLLVIRLVLQASLCENLFKESNSSLSYSFGLMCHIRFKISQFVFHIDNITNSDEHEIETK